MIGRGIPLAVAESYGVRYTSDWFGHPAVLFPFTDARGRLVAVEGRYIDDARSPKTRAVGNKKDGLFQASGALESNRIIVTEGPFDALSLAECGFPAAALGGTNCPGWLPKKAAFKTVIVATDNDTAGEEATKKLSAVISRFGAECLRLRPALKDWNDELQSKGVSSLAGVLDQQLTDTARQIGQVRREAPVTQPVPATVDTGPHENAPVAPYDDSPADHTSPTIIAVDTQTTGLDAFAGLVGISVATECGDSVLSKYMPIGHKGGVQLDKEDVLKETSELMASGKVVMHNAAFDLNALENAGATVPPSSKVHDTSIIAVLLDENGKHGLKDLVKRHLGMDMKSYDSLFKRGQEKSAANLLPQEIESYARDDARATLLLFKKLHAELEQHPGLLALYQVERKIVDVVRQDAKERSRGRCRGCEEAQGRKDQRGGSSRSRSPCCSWGYKPQLSQAASCCPQENRCDTQR